MEIISKMKIDELFNSKIKSDIAPKNIKFTLAIDEHVDDAVILMHERNPNESIDILKTKTLNEIKLNSEDPFYWLYIAIIKDEVVGLCRFYHSSGLPLHKKIFSSPEGWYGMGILVKKDWRRKNIAKFLSSARIKKLKKLNAKKFYSIVDSENLTSRKMHEEFGFKKVDEAQGFLHLDFKDKNAYLYELEID